MASTSDGDVVVLELTDPSRAEEKLTQEELSISISDAHNWDLSSITSSRVVRVRAKRSRLIQQSSYFRSLFSGSFSESSMEYVPIQWSLEIIIDTLRCIYGCAITINSDNFLPLLEGALFFGAECLLLQCETWFCKVTSALGHRFLQMSLDSMLEIWNFGLEHGIGFIPDLCIGSLARNFAWATSCSAFADIPYSLLDSCINHPQLTVESEKQLCEALLLWLSSNMESSECSSVNSRNGYFDILKKVRINLLPLGFVAGQRRCFPKFGCECVGAILDLMKDYSPCLMDAIVDDEINKFRIRLTKYSKKVVLSGCVHITVAFLFLAVFPDDFDARMMTRIIHSLVERNYDARDYHPLLEKSISTLSFETVGEVDISKCPELHVGATIKWLHLAFPSLKILKASHCLQFKMEDLYYLVQKCPLIEEVDLSVDLSPVVSTKISILSASTEEYQLSDRSPYSFWNTRPSFFSIYRHTFGKPLLSNIAKLTLEGRNEISDSDLLNISALANSLAYLNIKGCTLVTDVGISRLLCDCFNLHSMVLSYTSFGRYSASTLCSNSLLGHHGLQNEKHPHSMAFSLQQLHIDGCRGVDQNSLSQLLSHMHMLRNLSLRETQLTDDALYHFKGSCLERIDVSETLISVQALAHVLKRNPGVRYLKATGCKNLHQSEGNNLSCTGPTEFGDIFNELAEKCILEEVAFGWGFSSIPLEKLERTVMNLRAITLGLGASLSHCALCVLPKICPLLETVILIFQVISDNIMRSIVESLKHLQVLELQCCLGDLTSLSFQISMPNLSRLKLEWVTPWMTNNDLALLTQSCLNLVDLSLSGCKLLNSDSQQIISSGWPGLTVIHLEDCGNVTSHGVSFLLDCKAIEDLLLRHNGCGIPRSFICDAASKLPSLRKVTLDMCDACDGGFDSPSHAEKFFLSTLKISRCKAQRCGFELREMENIKAVHKETVVLEWNHKELRTTVVKERI